MAQEFWRLHYVGDDGERKAAWWDERVKHYGAPIVCTENPGHQRAGKRIKDLHVVLPRPPIDDFVWTWPGECMIQDHVLELFRKEGFTGFEVKPVTARFKNSDVQPPRLWELVITGWAGVAPPESGVRLVKSCAACGLLEYSGFDDPSRLIDPKQWDASDFFIVWPLPKFIFITSAVAAAIATHNLTGFVLEDPKSLRLKSLVGGLGPGRLSYWMPEDRARELGEPLGIF